jgi:glucosamine--fructose-6-phosphate aminotransferase (isomerizing)
MTMVLETYRPTAMAREAAEAPACVARQWRAGAGTIRGLAARLRANPPRTVVTIARGSSDNAATYARYMIETRLEVLTASLAPSTASVFTAQPEMTDVLALAISQSGRSPDLLAAARGARDGGALLVALVNDSASPLADLADVVIPLDAGPELSVAATKSFITALGAIAALVACWADDQDLLAAIEALPATLALAWDSDWTLFVDALADAVGLYVLGRGPGFAAAQEAALKLKETCGLHAEAFSAAEVRHGPMALIHSGFPVIAFVPDDAGREGVDAAIAAARAQGATLLEVGGDDQQGPILPACHPALTPIVQIQGFYRMVDALAARRGYDPDNPPHLSKVTSTR